MGRPAGGPSQPRRERRRHPRYRLREVYHVRTTALSEHGLDRPGPMILGRIHDIGAGGLCLLSDQMVPVAQLARCEIVLPGVPAAVPTLVRIRWCVKEPRRVGYKAGAEFLVG